MATEKLAYTINEAADSIGMGRTKIYQFISEGRLTAVKAGNRTLITAEALRAFVNSLPQAA